MTDVPHYKLKHCFQVQTRRGMLLSYNECIDLVPLCASPKLFRAACSSICTQMGERCILKAVTAQA